MRGRIGNWGWHGLGSRHKASPSLAVTPWQINLFIQSITGAKGLPFLSPSHPRIVQRTLPNVAHSDHLHTMTTLLLISHSFDHSLSLTLSFQNIISLQIQLRYLLVFFFF